MASSGRPELPEGGDSGSFLRSFGRQVKIFRERAGLTQVELGREVGYGEDQIGAVEQGKRIPKPEFVDRVDHVLNAGGVLMAMKGEIARVRYPAFFRGRRELRRRPLNFTCTPATSFLVFCRPRTTREPSWPGPVKER